MLFRSGGKFFDWSADKTDYYYNQLFQLRNVNWNNDLFTQALPTPTLFNEVRIPFLKNTDEYLNIESTGNGNQLAVPALGRDHQTNLSFDNTMKMATIRQLRENIALQHFLETMQQGGGRYMETMKLIWGQDIPDATLQRSEYLGGDVTPIFFNEVESNAGTDVNALGDVAGKPISADKGKHRIHQL